MKLAIISGSGLEDFKVPGIICINRHGEKHETPPHKIDYKKILLSLKEKGVTHVIGISSAGSVKKRFKVGDLVLPENFVDISCRNLTFFDDECRHTYMGKPFDFELADLIYDKGLEAGVSIHNGGIIITINGPRFSTKEENALYRKWDMDLINMTTATECVLANELGLKYACLAIVTDSDYETEDLSLEKIQEVVKERMEDIKRLLMKVAEVEK